MPPDAGADRDPLDYTDRFNTELDPDEEAHFQSWLRKNSRALGRDLSRDLEDYDLRGQYKGTGGAMIEPGHGTDTWKKPNHPTFSDESIYHGKDGFVGGHWGEGTYTPGATNLQMRSPEQLSQYFRDIEPDIKLLVPGAQPAAPQGKSMPLPEMWSGGDPGNQNIMALMQSLPPDQRLKLMMQLGMVPPMAPGRVSITPQMSQAMDPGMLYGNPMTMRQAGPGQQQMLDQLDMLNRMSDIANAPYQYVR